MIDYIFLSAISHARYMIEARHHSQQIPEIKEKLQRTINNPQYERTVVKTNAEIALGYIEVLKPQHPLSAE